MAETVYLLPYRALFYVEKGMCDWSKHSGTFRKMIKLNDIPKQHQELISLLLIMPEG